MIWTCEVHKNAGITAHILEFPFHPILSQCNGPMLRPIDTFNVLPT